MIYTYGLNRSARAVGRPVKLLEKGGLGRPVLAVPCESIIPKELTQLERLTIEEGSYSTTTVQKRGESYMQRVIMVAAALITSLCACRQRTVIVQDIPPSARAVDVSEERALMDAEHAWVKTAIAGDADAFGRFMADEYVAQGSKGALLTKAAWVQRMREGKSKFQAVNFCNMIVRVNGDAAVVTADFAQIATRDGKDNSGKGSEMDFWVKRRGRWLVIASAFGASSPQCST